MALNLTMTRLKTSPFLLTVTNKDTGAAYNLTGTTLHFHASVGGVSIDKSTGSGITVTNAAGGLATLEIASTDTQSVPITGTYSGSCELVVVDGGKPYEMDRGTLTVYPNVSTP